jgi:hypothetical protein
VKKIEILIAMAICAWMLNGAVFAAGEFKGNWTLMPSKEAGKVQFGLFHRHDGGNSHSENDWPVSALQGLDLATRARHDVRFTIARDAGRFDCDGYLTGGEGAGIFRFTHDAQFARAMRDLGFDGIDENKQFAMAVHDVTLEFARQMKAEKLTGFDTDKLIAFRIFDVNPQFIREMRAEGLRAADSDRLIAFRVHGVTPILVRDLKRAQIEVDEDQLIAFRVHGVTPEFIASVEAMGFTDVEPDQLIAMRVHGVTPEFISEMKSRGLKDLSIDKLVALRVHGID